MFHKQSSTYHDHRGTVDEVIKLLNSKIGTPCLLLTTHVGGNCIIVSVNAKYNDNGLLFTICTNECTITRYWRDPWRVSDDKKVITSSSMTLVFKS